MGRAISFIEEKARRCELGRHVFHDATQLAWTTPIVVHECVVFQAVATTARAVRVLEWGFGLLCVVLGEKRFPCGNGGEFFLGYFGERGVEVRERTSPRSEADAAERNGRRKMRWTAQAARDLREPVRDSAGPTLSAQSIMAWATRVRLLWGEPSLRLGGRPRRCPRRRPLSERGHRSDWR